MEIKLFLKIMSGEGSDGRENSVRAHDRRQFDVSDSWAGFKSNSPSPDGLTPSLGCQCKVIGRKVYYGPG